MRSHDSRLGLEPAEFGGQLADLLVDLVLGGKAAIAAKGMKPEIADQGRGHGIEAERGQKSAQAACVTPSMDHAQADLKAALTALPLRAPSWHGDLNHPKTRSWHTPKVLGHARSFRTAPNLVQDIVGSVEKARAVEAPFYISNSTAFSLPKSTRGSPNKPVYEDYRPMSGRSKGHVREDGIATRVKIDLFPE